MNQVSQPTQTHLYMLANWGKAGWAGPAHLTALVVGFIVVWSEAFLP